MTSLQREELLAAKRRRQWATKVASQRAWAYEQNAAAAVTIPDALFELLAEERVHMDMETEKHWPIPWTMDDGELGPERAIVLEIEHGYTWGSQGKHLLEIETMADLECIMNESLDRCVCSDCSEDPGADDAYDDWKVWQ